MRKTLLMIGTLSVLLTTFAFGQRSLPQSRRSSPELMVYKLSEDDVRDLYLKEKNLEESMLHTLVARWMEVRDIPPLPRGNYIRVRVVDNKLEYSDHTVDNLYHAIVEDEKVMLFLSDTLGNVIRDATVRQDLKRLKYDENTRTYNTRRVRDEKIVEINNDGVLHYIEFEKEYPNYYRSNFFWNSLYRITNGLDRVFAPGRASIRNKYNGFVVFSKPKYKPGETIRFKAYINHNGKPYNKDAEFSIVSYYPVKIDTTLATLHPYRPGMYEGEFLLSDSLKLPLDNKYNIVLKTKGKHTNNIQGDFYYEEYELGRITFEVKTDRERYIKGDPVKLQFSASDENDMPIYDGRIDLTVRPSKRHEQKYYADAAFIPDEIWKYSYDVSGKASEELVLPDSIFIPATGIYYEVECSFFDSSNEKHDQMVTLFVDKRERLIDFSVGKGAMTIKELVNGESTPVQALVIAYNSESEIVSRDSVVLPYSSPLKGIVNEYQVITETSSGKFFMEEVVEDILEHQFYKEDGDIRLVVSNPSEVPFWYTIRKNKQVIDKGYALELDYTYRDKGKNGYEMQLSYLLGETARTVTGSLPYAEKNLSLEVNTPTMVYPGQTATVDVLVKDKKGRPVSNADITAYAFTSKFGTYTPNVTIFGRSVIGKRFYNTLYDTYNAGPYNAKSPLEWEIWKDRMGLDSIEYYRFLYPDIHYSYSEEVADGRTQIAPYAVVDGNLLGVHILWIDEQPYYFDKSGQLDVYSFPVTPGYHTLRFRTYDREIIAENVYVPEGMKTILSVNGKKSDVRSGTGDKGDDNSLRVIVKRHNRKNRGLLGEQEMNALKDHMITMDNPSATVTLPNDDPVYQPAIIEAGGIYHWVNHSIARRYDYRTCSRVSDPILVGPFPFRELSMEGKNTGTLYVDTMFVNNFNIQGGYRYGIGKDRLEQTKWGQVPFSSKIRPFTPRISFSQNALSVESVSKMFHIGLLERVQQKSGLMIAIAPIDSNGVNMPVTAGRENDSRLRLEIGNFDERKVTDTPLLISISVIEGDNSTRYIYYGGTRNFNGLQRGDCQIDLIFRDSTRYTVLTKLREKGLNYLKIDSIKPAPIDSIGLDTFDLLYSNTRLSGPDNRLSEDNLFLARNLGGFNVSNYTGELITGTVLDPNGEPLIGAIVTIEDTSKGSSTGAVTDIDGKFRLSYTGPGNLLVSYIGFTPFTTRVTPGYDYRIILGEDVLALEEVVVTGFGSAAKENMSMIASTDEGIFSLLDLFESEELEGKVPGVLAGTQARGTSQMAGLLSIPDNSPPLIDGVSPAIPLEGRDFPDGWSNANSLRVNFHDDAFWYPSLFTGKDGTATFEITYPDDITSWNANFIAVGGKKQTDKARLTVRSFKPINAQLSLPRFAILDDSLNMIGRLTNHQGDTVTIKRSVDLPGYTSEEYIVLSSSHVDTIPMLVNNLDSITVTYSMTMENGYLDGERRTIPIYQPGVLESHGEFVVLDDTVSHRFQTNPTLTKATVHAETSWLQSFLDEMDYIDQYPYLCNEQIASKIKALLLKKRVFVMFGMEFKEDRKIRNYIRRLERNKNSDNLWGWWNQDKTELWISKHIVEVMLDAEADGYAVGLDKHGASRALAGELERRLATANDANASPYFVKHELLNVLELLMKLDADIDYAHYFKLISSLPDDTSNDKLRAMQMALLLDTGDTSRVDTLLNLSPETMLESLCFAEKENESTLSRNLMQPHITNTENTLIAYRILRERGGYEKELAKMRSYFFEIRHRGTWQNIYESARIMETILPDMIKPGEGISEVSPVLSINGKQFDKFPLTEEFEAGKMVEVRKVGAAPVFFTVYQQAWNSLPDKASEGFSVETAFYANDDIVTLLETGKSIDLRVTVSADADAEYVTIEVPIPAGCTYESKNRGDFWKEAHREYYKDKVVIFCHRLSQGTHDFTIKLLPRYTGLYHLNPAKAELMYFPTFFGRGNTGKCIIH